MTAEIAILNKTAIALAADSAVTISIGSDQTKVYDSEDKLFELSRHDAVGIMINNNMHFMEAPLPVLIKRYRSNADRVVRVTDAAKNFLSHLQRFGKDSPEAVGHRSIIAAVRPVLTLLRARADTKFRDRLFGPDSNPSELIEPNGYANLRDRVFGEQISALEKYIGDIPPTKLIGRRRADSKIPELIKEEIAREFPELSNDLHDKILSVARLTLTRRVLLSPHTGVVVAGFGKDDIFPTLVSYEVFGMVEGRLRIFQTNHEDVDREGPRARVIPFAQKDMVERFLYGLDDFIKRQITEFCRSAVPRIRERTLDRLEMTESDRAAVERDMEESETAFLESLRDEAFDAMRDESREEIEDMVEFMPKSEMARMAEALVNLTSIKRRVSRGMETVGGPIDCAVISQADGFVWVKRKHYFPGELNRRYFDRMRDQIHQPREP